MSDLIDEPDRELPDESDMDSRDEFDETEPCPHCKQPIHDEAEICHHCGSFIDRNDPAGAKPPWLTIAVIVVMLAAMVLWFI